MSILDCVALEKLKPRDNDLDFAAKKAILSNVYTDISQNPIRRNFTNARGITGTITTSTMLYSFHRDGIILPLELMMLQGHRRDFSIPYNMTSMQLKELAGEGIFLPCLGVVLWAMYITKGFP